MSTAPNIGGGEQVSPPSTYCNYVQAHWAFASAAYLAHCKLGSSALLVLLCLAKHYNRDEHKSWPGYTTIHRETLLSKSTISDALRDLERVKILHVTRGDSRRANRYWFDFGVVQIWTSSNLDYSKSEPQESKSEPLRFESEPEDVKEEVNGRGEEKKSTVSAEPVGHSPVEPLMQDMGKAKTKTTPATPRAPYLYAGPGAPAARSTSPAVPRPQATAAPSSPEAICAARYAKLISPREHEDSAITNHWPAVFRRLLDQYGEEALWAIITWAKEHHYWGGKLARYTEDSADFLEENIRDIANQRATEAEREARKQNRERKATTTTNNRQAAVPLDPEVAAKRARMRRMIKPE